MRKPLIQIISIFTVLIIISNVSAQNLDIENTLINSVENYSEETITIGPNVTIGASGIAHINTNTLAIKPQFNIVAGGQLHLISGTITGIVLDKDGIAPDDFKVSQNFPNPFNPATTINYTLPKSEQVEIVIYNIYGQMVKTLTSGYKSPGNHTVSWDGTDSSGKGVSSGVYFYQVSAGYFNQVKKMTLLK